jgi:hypothetical protein
MYPLTITIEPDDFAGFHCVLVDPVADVVLHVTDSYLTPQDALEVAGAWIHKNHRLPQSA